MTDPHTHDWWATPLSTMKCSGCDELRQPAPITIQDA